MKCTNLLSKFFIMFMLGSYSGFILSSAAFEVVEDVSGDVTGAIDKATGSFIKMGDDVEEDAFIKSIQDLNAKLAEVTDVAEREAVIKAENFTTEQVTKDAIEQMQTFSTQEALSRSIAKEAQDLAEKELGAGGGIIKTAKNTAEAVTPLKNLNKLRGALERSAQRVDGIVTAAEKNVQAAANDFKKFATDNQGLAKRYMTRLDGISDKALSSVDRAAAEKAITDALQKGDTKALQKACLNVAKLDAIKGMEDEFASLDRAGIQPGSAAEKLLTRSVKSMDTAFSKLDAAIDKGQDLLEETVVKDASGNVVKDADGASVKESVFSKFVKDDLSTVSKGAQQDMRDGFAKIDGQESKLLENLNWFQKIDAKLSASTLLRPGAIGDAFDDFATKLKGIKGKISLSDVAESVMSGVEKVGSGITKFSEKALEKTGAALEMLVTSVLFMAPNIFESAFLAQKQKQVALQTLAAPIKFGDWVLQIPNSCFNFDNPTATLPIYTRIPVANVGDDIAEAVMKQFGSSIKHQKPQTNNAVTNAINTAGANFFSFGGASQASIPRYSIDESSYFPKSGLVVSYDSSMLSVPGSYPLTSSQFTGLMVDLNSGYVMDASGEQNSIMPLIPPVDPHNSSQPTSPQYISVKNFLPFEQGKVGVAPEKISYIQYVDIGTGSAGAQPSHSLQAQFDCKCIPETEENGSNVSTGAISTCLPDFCLLTQSLANYMSGLSINAAGLVGLDATPAAAQTPAAGQTPAASQTPSTALGSVIPMYGWGTTGYDTIINETTFPGYTPSPSQSSGTGITLLPTATSKTKEDVYADASINYAAQGCQVYICANTPFAKAVQQGSTNTSVYGPYVDYIIFFDKDANQVPLNVPTQQPISSDPNVLWPTIGLNPDIQYWASLLSGDNTLYDLQGNPAATDTGLGVPSGSGIIAAAVAELSTNSVTKTPTFPLLASQFAVHSDALISKYSQGPFVYGHTTLTESKETISVPASGSQAASTLSLYEGGYCFASQGAASQVKDILIAQDNTGLAGVQLPDSAVDMFYSLVTDIGYSVVNGSLQATDFSQAPLTKSGKTYKLVRSEKDTFNLFTAVAGATATVPDYLTRLRNDWWLSFDPSAEAQGFTVGKLHFKLAQGLDVKAAVASKCFIYEVTPSPSFAITNQDLYILVATSSPMAEALTPIDAASSKAENATVVSLMTGYLYDTKGNPKLDSNGHHKKVKSASASATRAQLMQQALTNKFSSGGAITEAFYNFYLNMVNAYVTQARTPIGPKTFGTLHLGIYAGDLYDEKYVYFSAAGMHQPNFEPSDMFVTVNGYSAGGNLTLATTKLDGNTTHMMSLVTGQLYDRTGVAPGTVPLSQESIFGLSDQLSADWSLWAQDNLKRLQQTSKDLIAAQKAEQEKLDELEKQKPTTTVFMLPETVTQIIKGLSPSGSKGLSVPYSTLKQHKGRNLYVRLSPANDTDSSEFLYQFFDVPNNETNAAGLKVATGAIYRKNGQQVRVIQGAELKATKDMYGVVVNADGTQSLAVPLLKPSLLLEQDDQGLTAGKSGSSMISSLDPDFPGGRQEYALPKTRYYIYFSKHMGTYYLYETKRKQWISIKGGNLYEQDGTPVKVQQQVAVAPGKKGVDDMILLYENSEGYMQGYMSDGGLYINVNSSDGNDMTWMNVSLSSPTVGNTLTVSDNKTHTTFTIDSKEYTVNDSYFWNPMIYVPIDDDGNYLEQASNNAIAQAQLVTKNGNISHMIYNQTMYKASKAVTLAALQSTTLTMTPLNNDSADPIVISAGVDTHTKAPFIMVNKDYRYSFVFSQLDDTQLANYQTKVWKGDVVACPMALPVGPMTTQTITVGGNKQTIVVPDEATHVLFVQNIQNVNNLKQLSSVKSIVNAPTSGTELQLKLGVNLLMINSSADGRFFASLPAYTAGTNNTDDSSPSNGYSYFANGGYVDLQTGALFDNTGISVGYSLNFNDWLAVLNKVQVTVAINPKTGKNQLIYRNAGVVQLQTDALAAVTRATAAPGQAAARVQEVARVQAARAQATAAATQAASAQTTAVPTQSAE
ncbi:MAG TPA: hypothetical protein VLG50_03440 [Candidatus Saccharimonadales bacterium]|nr:hypothetical protein [Candidatus Saccharimonadales bacterium]